MQNTENINNEDETIIEIFNISKEYNLQGREEKVFALKNINLNKKNEFYGIKKGEFVIIRGPSGGGKTTLLNIMGTIDTASSGQILIMGNKIEKESDDNYLSQLRLKNIGFVFQSFNLIATMTAQENVELPMRILNSLTDKQINKKAIQLLTRVGLQD